MTETKNIFNFKNKTAYHYCSIDALFKILSSKSLWLTSLSSTNDKQELNIGRKIINEKLDELINKEKDSNLHKVLEAIRNASKDRKTRMLNQYLNYYAAAFVCIPDSLTHWERYGDQSKGVCIELNLKMLEAIFKGNMIPDYLSNWIEQRDIIYKREYQLKFLEEELFFQINSFNDLFGHHQKKEKLPLYEFLFKNPILFILLYHNVLSTITPIFKHQGFSDENESRLLFLPGDAETRIENFRKLQLGSEFDERQKQILNQISKILSELELNRDKKRYAVINGSIRSLYSMNLSTIWSSLLVPKIIIGPKCLQNVKELRKFVKSIGLAGTKIHVSKIPIR